MKKIFTLSGSFLWALLAVTLFNVSGSIIAMEEEALTPGVGPYGDLDEIQWPGDELYVIPGTKREKKLKQALLEQALKEGTPNIQDIDGNTPLHIAVENGDLSIIERLFNAGADLDILNNSCYAPLNTAVRNGDLSIIECLFNAGADPNIFDCYGYAPLHFAAKDNETSIVRLLLAKGADPSIQTNEGKTAIDFACSKEIKSLIQGEINLRWALARQAIKEKFETQGREVPELIEKILAYAYPNEAARRANERQSSKKEEGEPGI